MVTNQHKKAKSLLSISFLITAFCALLIPSIPLSFIVGSFFRFFSIKNCIIPLSGAFGGIAGSSILSFARLLIGFFTVGIGSFKTLALYIPGFFGSLYWASQSAAVRIAIPALCMLLFTLHPVGSQAYAYSLFWLIPIALYFVPKKSLFLEALGSTYTAHAVGSVIWLYATEMSPATWLGLIPVGCAERILFAGGMTAAHVAIAKIEAVVSAQKSIHALKSKIYSSLS